MNFTADQFGYGKRKQSS